MDEILSQQIEALLGTQYSTKGLGKNIVTLSGFLADYPLPEDIASQLERLSRLVVLQDQFDALLQSLNQATAHTTPSRNDAATGTPQPSDQWRGRILDQIESVRADINATSPINYSDLIAWLAGRARERNILRMRSRR